MANMWKYFKKILKHGALPIGTYAMGQGGLKFLNTKGIYPQKWVESLLNFVFSLNLSLDMETTGLFLSGFLAFGLYVSEVWFGWIEKIPQLFKGKPTQQNIQAEKVEPPRPLSIESELTPDINMSDAIDHVVSILCPDKDPNHIDYSREIPPACEQIIKKLRSGELTAWGKRIEIVVKYGRQKYRTHSTNSDRIFDKIDWEYRELIPLSASIPRKDRPQTKSFGSSKDHIQLTALRVNLKEVQKLWPGSNTMENSPPLILHNYQNCTIYQYPDGTAKSEPQNSITEKDKPTSISFNPTSIAILISNNISSLADNGTGDFTINFDAEVEGHYNVQVLSDTNYEYEINNKTKNGFNITFSSEPVETIKLIVHKNN